jgi:hypothetical protein
MGYSFAAKRAAGTLGAQMLRMAMAFAYLSTLLSGCGWRPSPEQMAGFDTSEFVASFVLRQWRSDLNTDATVHVVRLSNTDGRSELHAFVALPADNKQPGMRTLGPLKRHWPEIPIDWVFFEVSGERFVIGYVDPVVTETVDSVVLEPGGMAIAESVNQTVAAIPSRNNRTFGMPLVEDSAPVWTQLRNVRVTTVESMAQARAEQQRTGVLTASTPWVERTWDPPLDITAYYVAIPTP